MVSTNSEHEIFASYSIIILVHIGDVSFLVARRVTLAPKLWDVAGTNVVIL